MTEQRPLFSVVVPTFRRSAQLAACLDALARQEFARERFEAIVVNDGGPEPREALARLEGRLDVVLITQAHAGPAAARNAGARRARGRFLAFTDDDCAPDPAWLKALEARLTKAPEHAVGGRTVNALPRNLFSTASQSLTEYLYEYFDADAGRAAFFASNNLALPSELFAAVGGFDESFPLAAGEDRELCDRWRARGYELTYAPEAVVRHAHALTLRSFWRQHFNYGRSAVHFRRARAGRGGGAVRVEPADFYARMLRHPFAREPRLRASLVSALIVVSQAANAAGFFRERLRARPGVARKINKGGQDVQGKGMMNDERGMMN